MRHPDVVAASTQVSPQEKSKRLGRVLTYVRGGIYVGAILAAALSGILVYAYGNEAGERAFASELKGLANLVEQVVQNKVHAAENAAAATSVAFIYPPGGAKYFPKFKSFSASMRASLDAHGMGLAAYVAPEDRAALNKYFADLVPVYLEDYAGSLRPQDIFLVSYKLRMGISGVPSSVNLSHIPFLGLSSQAPDVIAPSETYPNLAPFMAPLTQSEPIALSSGSILADMRVDPLRAQVIDRLVATGKLAWGGLALQVALTSTWNQVLSELVAPIFYTYDNGTSTITGFVGIQLSWARMVSLALPPGRPVDVVLTDLTSRRGPYRWTLEGGDSVNSTQYTLRVDAKGNITELGFVDAHDGRFDRWRSSFVVTFDALNRVQVEIYPRAEFVDGFFKDDRASASAGVAVAIVASVALVFIVFDAVARRHTESLSVVIAKERLDAEAERELAQQQRVFASMVAHELRTPTASVCGALDVLRATTMSADQRGFTEIISSGAAEILTLVEDMMSAVAVMGGPRAQFRLRPTVVDPAKDILEQAFTDTVLQRRFARNVASLDVRLQLREDLPKVAFLDGGRARQALANIIGNAIKFTHEGSVTVMTEYDRESSQLKVTVTDSGIGISEEGLGRLFKPFSQAEGLETKRRYGGTGLGLVVSRDICRALGGDLTLTSKGLGFGSEAVATFALPLPTIVDAHNRYYEARQPDDDDGLSQSGGAPQPQVSIFGLAGAMQVHPGGAAGGQPAQHHPPTWGSAFMSQLRPKLAPASGVRVSANLRQPTTHPCRTVESGGGAPARFQPEPFDAKSTTSAGFGETTSCVAVPVPGDSIYSPRPTDQWVASVTAAHHSSPPTSNGRSGEVASTDHIDAALIAGPAPRLVRVVAAEDDAMCRRVLGMSLRMAQYDVLCLAQDGKGVTDFLAAEPEAADLVILDGRMGGGDLDALPTLARLRQFYKDKKLTMPPVVVLTGDAADASEEEYKAAGASCVLTKPASLESLHDLRSLLVA